MCQLTFATFKNPTYTRMYSTMSIIMNTYTLHHDGWGIFAGTEIFKTAMNAQNTSDIGEIVLRYHDKTFPIMSHVRDSSWGAKVCKENSHPFETENFILMHNGTLVVKKAFANEVEEIKKKNKASADIIDSEIFVMYLEEKYKESTIVNKDKRFIAAISLSMKAFGGKFAFLIYCKSSGTYYIIRGRTADLYAVTFSKESALCGLVVNTERTCLEKTIHVFESITQATDIKLVSSEISELEKEAIYKYRANSLIKIGDLKEEEKETIPFVREYPTKSVITYYNGATTECVIENSLFTKLFNFMDLHYLSVEDMDKLFYFTMGNGILLTDKQDLEEFLNKVVHRLSVKKDFKKDLIKILVEKRLASIPIKFYEKNNFQFPYMMITERSEQMRFIKEFRRYVELRYG